MAIQSVSQSLLFHLKHTNCVVVVLLRKYAPSPSAPPAFLHPNNAQQQHNKLPFIVYHNTKKHPPRPNITLLGVLGANSSLTIKERREREREREMNSSPESEIVVVTKKQVLNLLWREYALRQWLQEVLVEDLTSASGSKGTSKSLRGLLKVPPSTHTIILNSIQRGASLRNPIP